MAGIGAPASLLPHIVGVRHTPPEGPEGPRPTPPCEGDMGEVGGLTVPTVTIPGRSHTAITAPVPPKCRPA